MKKCPHCGSMNLDAELSCGACGGSLDDPVVSVDPWINEGPHRTMRCQFCRARVPADQLTDHYNDLHPTWASWLPWRKRRSTFIKVSVIIILLLIMVAILTGNIGYPLVFSIVFISVDDLWDRLDRGRKIQAQLQWDRQST